MNLVASDQNWWKIRTEYLVGRSLAPARGSWSRVYASLEKNGLQFTSEQDYGSSLLVSILLQLGADPSLDQYTFVNVISSGNTEAVRLLLEDGRINPVWGDPLLDTIRLGYNDMTVLLLADSRVNPGKDDSAALTVAIRYEDTETVTLLLADPRVDPSSELEDEGIILASTLGHLEIVRMLLEDDRVDASVNGDLSILNAIKHGYIEVVRLILQTAGPPTTYSGEDECIPLAVQLGSMEMIKLLLEYWPNSLTANNNHALRLARRSRRGDIIDLLLSYPEVKKLDTELK